MAVRPLKLWAGQLVRATALRGRLTQAPEDFSRRANAQIVREKLVSKIIRLRFKTQGASSKRVWAPLDSETTEDRADSGFASGPKLIRTGTLRDAAVNGPQSSTSKVIRIRMSSGSGPTYKGRKGSTPLSVYAPELNKKRQFYGPFEGKERQKIDKRRSEIIAGLYAKALDGKG